MRSALIESANGLPNQRVKSVTWDQGTEPADHTAVSCSQASMSVSLTPAAAIMRYRPGATAMPHRHSGYELIYVLSGELETDDGTYPANSLLVMPPGSVHAPRSPRGCVGLVVWEQPVRPA